MKKTLIISLLMIVFLVLIYPFYYESQLKSIPELKKSYPSLSIEKGIILLIFAHSDDEIGIMAQIADLRRKNPESIIKWIIVSDGGRGFVFWGACGDLDKAGCRLKEAAKVALCAGLSPPRSLNLPDGRISSVKNLSTVLLKKIPELRSPDLKAVFTHDKRGLYGHPDHVAVHDAVAKALKGSEVPLISMALPDYFKQPKIMMEAGKGRHPEDITHVLDLNEEGLKVKKCVVSAHQSQLVILQLLMFKGLDADTFFKAAPREFLNTRFIPSKKQAPSSYE
jgi:LmbE family N-acetylglucosaminyl deacetylase